MTAPRVETRPDSEIEPSESGDPVDLRSDTVTRPTPAMFEAMVAAPLGDDVLGDDPTVDRLEARVAELFDLEAAAFVPSGTMANQAAIRALTEPGDEIVAHESSHIYQYEAGAWAAISGCSIRFVTGPRGQFDPEDVVGAIRAGNDHFPRTRLVVLENTANRGGGSIWPADRLAAVAAAAREHGLRVHLDGARLMNAAVASGHAPHDYTRHVDSVSMCFSKGLGCPVGSIVAGSAETIGRVERIRKLLGGTMRQSGLLAAAALHALDHHVERLADDHAHARLFALGLAELPHLHVDADHVETNIVYVDVDPDFATASDFVARMESAGVRVFATGPRTFRAVTHLDVSAEEVERAVEIVERLVT